MLFKCESLHFDIDSPMDAKQKITDFVEQVTSTLSDEIFDAVEKF